MISSGEQYTFWELIKQYKIVVPKIQRDYVQGRKNATVAKNRKEFVEELVDAIKNDKSMSLNFVYGTIRGNDFIPIDGQQRLTTLFLLHLYAFAKTEKKERIKFLQEKFSYQTRYTTNRFIEKLAENLPAILKSLKKEENDLFDVIHKSGWYASSWDNDPNVVSCLVILQLIHETWENKINTDELTEDWKITFMFLRLEEFGSDNRLYIRMNSRGKQLTDFENFKAELYEKILKSDENDSAGKINDFKKNIDGDWYSLFWDAELCRETSNKNQDTLVKNKDEENIEKRATLVDRLLQHIFHWTIVSAICAYKDAVILTSASKNATKEFVKSLYSDLQPGCEIERVYIQEYIDLYQNWKGNEDKGDLEKEERERREKERVAAFFNNIIKDFACTLSFLSELKREEPKKIFRFIINDIFQINYGKKDSINFTIRQYSARVLLYSITKFVKDYKMNDKIKAFKSWYRVVLNLVSTQEIDSPEDFQKAVRAIEEWNDNTADWLKSEKVKGAFRSAQVKEEILKEEILKLAENGDWESAIRNAENTNFDSGFDSGDGYKPRDYFRGQIGFLLHMAGVNEGNLKNLNQDQLNDFKYYSKAVREIFDERKYWEKKDDAKKEDPDKLTGKCDTYINLLQAADCKKYSFDNLFHRAMLACENYWVNAPGNNIKTFFVYNESHNNYDWRGAFRQKDDGKWGTAVGCLKDLLDNYTPKNPDKYNQKYEFNFEHFKDYLVDRIKAWSAGQIGNSNVNETAKERRLRNLLIREPNCFKYIRNNYYIYWGDKDQPPKYLLMRLKRKRDGSITNITNELTKGQTP